MSENNNELESLDENSYEDLDSFTDFVDVDDLTSLEGIEEYADILGPGGLDDTVDIPAPKTEEKALAEAMEKKAPMSDELFEDDTRSPGAELFIDESPLVDEEPHASTVTLPENVLDEPVPPGDDLSLDDLTLPEEEPGMDADMATGDVLSLDNLPLPESEPDIDADIALGDALSLDNLTLPEDELSIGDDMPLPEDGLSIEDSMPLSEEELLPGDDLPLPEDGLSIEDSMPLSEEELLPGDDLSLPEDGLSIEDSMPLSEEELSLGDDLPLPEDELSPGDDMPLPEEELSLGDDLPLPEDGLSLSDDMPLPEEELSLGDDLPLPEDVLSIEDSMPLSEEELSLGDDLPLPEDDLPSEDSMPLPEETAMDSAIPMPDDGDDALAALDRMLAADDFSESGKTAEPEEVAMDTDSMNETTESGGSNSDLDSMLDGILDDLDMGVATPGGDAPDLPMDDDLFGMLDDEEIDQAEELTDIGLPEADGVKEEKEPGLLKRLFGNIVTDEIAEAERQEMENEKVKAEEQAELDAKAKEEKAAAKAAKAEEKAKRKEEKAEEKAKKKEEKARLKAEKKAKKEEEAQAEEQFEVTGKLNKVGIAIIAVLTVLFLATEILGTNIHSMNRTKKAANSYFELGKYTEAYQEILGTNLKEKDPDTYHKIKTVMQVQRSLNAYDNYNEMNYYPDALNALLRGIQRYDANVENAKQYDVLGDLDHCKAQIVGLLQTEFGVSESDAYGLLALDKEQYTKRVVELAMARH